MSDDERRLVAERLRISDERDAAGFDCLLAEAVRGREFCETPCEHCHARLLGELADLIESSCDRAALLDIADECDMMRDDGLPIGSYEIDRIARRIREALGVSDD